MKRICLVRDEQEFWDNIASTLRMAHAEVCDLGCDLDEKAIAESRPDLVVTGPAHFSHLPSRFSRLPKIVIEDEGKHLPSGSAADENLNVLTWPIGRSELLEATSKMLSISPRKKFRTLIRIMVAGDAIGTMGRSVDFSLSGLAFATEKEYSSGQEVVISFSIPGEDQSIKFPVEIIRNSANGGDKEGLYGARYLDLSTETAGIVRDFILKE